MEIIDVPRGFGKTSYLIYKSEKTGFPIIVMTEAEKNLLNLQAKNINAKIPKPITINEFVRDNYRGKNKPECILIDELPNILSMLLGCNVEVATMTSHSKELYDKSLYKY